MPTQITNTSISTDSITAPTITGSTSVTTPTVNANTIDPTQGYLSIAQQNATGEGGEILLAGSNGNANAVIDKCMLTNQKQFFDAILPLTTGRHIVPPLIICGHVHSDHKVVREQMAIEMAPATAFGWEADDEPAVIHSIGYKQFLLQSQSYQATATVWQNDEASELVTNQLLDS